MTIGELARESGITDTAIRFYERQGLIRPDRRTESNYRVFGSEAVSRLRFIRSGQAAGLSLEDIRSLLDIRDGVAAPCPEVHEIVDARLQQVTEQIQHLRDVEDVLRGYQRACEKTARNEPCPVLHELDDED